MTCVAALRTTQPMNCASTYQLKRCKSSRIQIASAVIGPKGAYSSYGRSSFSLSFSEDAFPEIYDKILPIGMNYKLSTLPLAAEVGYYSLIGAIYSNILSIFNSSQEIGYSSLSLYFTLALYVLSLPGLFSLVSRSVKVKVL